jgi:hypothetical protein
VTEVAARSPEEVPDVGETQMAYSGKTVEVRDPIRAGVVIESVRWRTEANVATLDEVLEILFGAPASDVL